MAEPPSLRRAGAADAAAVRDLTRAAYAKWVRLIGREPKPMTADYDRAVAEHRIDLWEADGELLGLVETIPAPDHLLIENLAVRPDRQGKGLGDRLLQHAEVLAASLGVAEVRLYTNAAFAANLAFYQRRGYEEFRREELAPGRTVVHMRKRISPGR
ncbi:MAG TPA: GNAT family N-acetyltransferase [Stellaceae bacterium]|nr:GNAT family N-acetyltransferase [Stellaceae bacterium]